MAITWETIDIFGPGVTAEVSSNGYYRVVDSFEAEYNGGVEITNERRATQDEMIAAGFYQPAYRSKLAAAQHDWEGGILARQERLIMAG